MKIIRKNIEIICKIFITAIVSLYFVTGEATDECLDLMLEMKNCSNEFHIPEKCNDSSQSKLYNCAEAVAEKVHLCPDRIAQKMINYFVTTYKLSDQVICENNMHAEITDIPQCIDSAKAIIVNLAYLTPGFLTEKGCRFFKTMFFMSALAQDIENCFRVIKDYIDIMYSKSTCNETEIETPTASDVSNMIEVIINLRSCWTMHKDIPKCDGRRSRRVQCVEDDISNRILNPNLKSLETNILNVTEMTDEVMCSNEQLKKQFESNIDCLSYALNLGIFYEVNGYYTEEGCESLKYREKYKLATVEEHCRPILTTYSNEMKNVLPCAKEIVIPTTPLIPTTQFSFRDSEDECFGLIQEVSKCSSNFHDPEKCKTSRTSTLVACAEEVANKLDLSNCTSEIARKIIQHFVETYKLSDEIFCRDELFIELRRGSLCEAEFARGTEDMGYLTPGSLTEKGCKFVRSMVYSYPHVMKSRCDELLENFKTKLFSKSTCSNVEVEIPTADEFSNILNVQIGVERCWREHIVIPDCNSTTKSRQVQCIENETINRIKNLQFKTLESNILMVAEKMDEILCSNKQLKKDFESNHECLEYVPYCNLWLTEVNGFYTEEGCEGLKYDDRYKFLFVEQQCRPIIKDYWKEMKNNLPCAVSTSFGEKEMYSVCIIILSTLVSTILMKIL